MRLNKDDGPLVLLHIDDSANDRLLVREAILLSNTPFKFYQANGLESAMPYFQSHGQNGEPTQFPRPSLVLLDYDLGDHTGGDVLYWLRLIQKITSIPVIMLCGSVAESQIAECYANGANHYMNKPKDLERLKIIVRTLHLSLVSMHRPGPIRLLQEYQCDPRKHATMATTSVLTTPPQAPEISATR